MHLSPDQNIFWQHGVFKLNTTIVTTWGLMLVMVTGSWLVTRRISQGVKIPRWQNLLEIVLTGINKQIEAVGLARPEKYLSFLGTLFLFIAVADLATLLPGYEPPTGSLSTTVRPGHLCVCGRAGLWDYGTGVVGIFENIFEANRPDAAVQSH